MKMRDLTLAMILSCYCGCFPCGTATAAIIYDSGVGGPTAINLAYLADSDPDFSGYALDAFQLAPGANTIQSVRWSGVYAYDNSPTAFDHFTIQIYEAVAGQPNPTPWLSFFVDGAVQRVDSGVDIASPFGPLDIYEYEAGIGAVTLPSGTTYWISIFNDTSLDPDDLWLWNGLSAGGNEMYRFDPSEDWFPQEGVLDFQLVGPSQTVPEPSAWLLFMGGACFLFARTGGWRLTAAKIGGAS